MIKKIILAGLITNTAVLNSTPLRLDPVVVTNKKYNSKLKNSESRTIIHKDEIRKSGARNLPDLLETKEGIQIERYGGQGQLASIRIRGSAPSQVLILVDGIPINSGLGGGADIGSLNLNNIEKIEIIRGGASAILGGGAFAGAILISTKPERLSNGGTIDLSWGSFKTWGTDTSLQIRSTNPVLPSIHTSLSFSGSDGGYLFPGQIALKGDGGYTLDGEKVKHRNSGFTAGAGNVRLHWGSPTNFLGDITFRYNYREAGVPGTIDFPTVDATQRDKQILLSMTGQYHNAGSIQGNTIRLRLFYQQQKRLYQDFALFSSEQKHNLQKAGLRLHYCFTRKKIITTLGSALELEKMDSNTLSKSELTRNQISTWGSIKLKPSKRLLINSSIRLDKMSGFTPAISPKAGAAFQILSKNKLSLKANIGQSYRLPTFSDLFWPDTFFAAGNPDLKPEKSLSFDIGLESKPALWLSGKIFFFQSFVTDLIRWEPSAGGVWRPSNLGRGQIRGLEAAISIQKQLGLYLIRVTANYTLQQVTDTSDGTNDGNQLPRRPYEKAACALYFISGNGWNLKLEGDYLGFRYINAANTKYLGDYFLLNFTGGIYFKCGIRLQLTVRNILDTSYIHVREYPVPGREFRIESGYRF